MNQNEDMDIQLLKLDSVDHHRYLFKLKTRCLFLDVSTYVIGFQSNYVFLVCVNFPLSEIDDACSVVSQYSVIEPLFIYLYINCSQTSSLLRFLSPRMVSNNLCSLEFSQPAEHIALGVAPQFPINLESYTTTSRLAHTVKRQ